MEKKILVAYTNIIIEYLSAVGQSNILKNTKHHNYLTYIGLNSILYIFKLVLLNTNDLQNATHNSQKGFYYYLEFMEQIKDTNISYNMNNIDAIKFIYNKTLNDIFIKKEETLLEKIPNSEEYKNQEKKINILLQWENMEMSLENRIELSKKYILQYLLIDSSFSYFFDYLERIIEKTKMDFETYCHFLSEFYICLSKMIKNKKVLDQSSIEYNYFFHFHIDTQIYDTFIKEKNMNKFVRSLFLQQCAV